MAALYAISLFLILAYIIIIARYCYGWLKIREHKNVDGQIKTGISIIIPCRNERANLLNCLEAISNQDFPSGRYETILVDDHSDDQTADAARKFFLDNPKLSGRVLILTGDQTWGKKSAISLGVNAARYPLVVTTDADCIAPATWLRSLVSYYEISGAKMIAAPVKFIQSSSIVEQIQELEILGLQAVAGGGIYLNEPVLCNGANLCYEKAAFVDVGGYGENLNILSGDDLFILQKIGKKYPGKVKFLKSRQAMVQTSAKSSATEFMSQRTRWVSKVVSVPDIPTIVVAVIVYLTNLSVLIHATLWLFLPDFNGSFLIITFGAKALIDFLFLHLATSFFNRGILMRLFVLAEVINVIYVAVIGVFGNIGNYRWKGRTSDQRSFVSNNS